MHFALSKVLSMQSVFMELKTLGKMYYPPKSRITRSVLAEKGIYLIFSKIGSISLGL